jgi:hypothetical protein
MNSVRRFFNSLAFIALTAFVALVALLIGFIMPNGERVAFLHSRAGEACGIAAAAVFITYLLLLPGGAIKGFFRSAGFIALLAVALASALTYLFITA